MKRARRASLLAQLTASEARVTPACTVVERCGGCPIAHAPRAMQIEAKRTWVLETWKEHGLDPSAIELEVAAPEPASGYRLRTRLAWARTKNAPSAAIGYREGDAREVITPERCVVLDARLEHARARLTDALAPILVGTGELRLGLSLAGDRAGATCAFDSPDAQSPAFYTQLEALRLAGVLLGARVKVGGASIATTIGEPRERSLDPDGRSLVAPIGGFRQAHVEAASALGSRVIAWGRPEGLDVIELHAGHGHFTLSLASRARSLLAVEIDREATDTLRENLGTHGLTADVRAEDATQALDRVVKDVRAKRRGAPDLVVLDPPRTGARDETTRLEALAPARIVYVSCDPDTFARDAARLSRTVPLRRVALLDLFPDTLHTELVALFAR